MFTRKSRKPDETEYEVTKTDAEWREQLSPDRYTVLRRAGTEPAWSGELLHVDGHGVFRCAGCGAELFDTDAKFESGTGWPSFDRARAAGTIIERSDRGFGMTRTEILCGRCGGHLGHVFPDGPTDTGLRYCVNSLSLDLRTRRRGGSGRGLSLRQPPLDGAEQRLEARRLGTQTEAAQQRASEGERAADLDDLVPQEVDRRSDRTRARSPISTPVPTASAAERHDGIGSRVRRGVSTGGPSRCSPQPANPR